MNQLNLSAHAYHRILKLARTISALAESKEIPGGSFSLAFSPNRNMLAFWMNDGQIEKWGWQWK